jgi:hypothetical protein
MTTLKNARRLAAVAVAVAGCFAATLSPVQAYDGQNGNDIRPARLAALRNATADYREFANSQQDGFGTLVRTTSGVGCITNAAGAMGEHWANLDRVGDGIIKELRPEVLMYEPQADGSKRLIGVEYVVIAAQWFETHDSPPVLFNREMELITSNPYGLPPYFAFHAWAWDQNPSGAFAPWNPTVTCP